MDQRQLERERIRLTREISMLESQLSAAQRGKEEKLEENKQIREEIAKLEEENKALEEETHRLDEEISGLDEEFKTAQLDAGRLRREIKINTERAENEKKKGAELRATIARLEKNLEDLKRKVKQEIDGRRNLESRLRKTNSQIDSMKNQKVAGFTLASVVTKKLEKQEWYQRMEEPYVEAEEGTPPKPPESAPVQEEAQVEAAPAEEPATAGPEEEKTPDESGDGGIDFSMD